MLTAIDNGMEDNPKMHKIPPHTLRSKVGSPMSVVYIRAGRNRKR